MADTESGLERLTKRYGRTATAPSTAGRYEVQQSFDARKQRLGGMPQAGQAMGTSDVSKQLAGIQMDLVELTETYGKLGLTFNNLVGSERLYGMSDAAKIMLYTMLLQKRKAREVKIEAIGRRGDAIDRLVSKMGEVIGDQYEKAVSGKSIVEKLQVENVALMKRLDQKLIESLKAGNYTGADMAQAESEVTKLKSELIEIDTTLMEYESKIQAAKSVNDLTEVQKLSDEVSKVLDMKYQVMDGKLSADGVVTEIRRQILDAAEGVQSAKGAMAASKVNYQAISALIDSMNELEIKYRHAREDMIPVFKIQGKISAMGTAAMDIKNTLAEVSKISTKLLDANANLVISLANETFNLLQNPLYDVSQAKAVEERISNYRTQLNALKMEWADQSRRLDQLGETPHYATHR